VATVTSCSQREGGDQKDGQSQGEAPKFYYLTLKEGQVRPDQEGGRLASESSQEIFRQCKWGSVRTPPAKALRVYRKKGGPLGISPINKKSWRGTKRMEGPEKRKYKKKHSYHHSSVLPTQGESDASKVEGG